MGRRFGVPHQTADRSKMRFAELNKEIARVSLRLGIASSTFLRQTFFSRLTWLETYREETFDITAPARHRRARRA